MPRPPCLTAALEYLARGWSPIPLCPPDHASTHENHQAACKSPGKAPLWPWKEYQSRLPRESELKLYWTRNPHCNVGLVMGPVSNLIGIDIDNEAGEEILREYLPIQTLEFATATGRRLLIKQPDKTIKIKSWQSQEGEALRILATGSQTVAPPSTHATGHKYAWKPGHALNEIEPAECPDWLIALMTEKDDQVRQIQPTQAAMAPANNTNRIGRAVAYMNRCEPAISGQAGHNQTFKIACKLTKGFSFTEDEAYTLIAVHYNPRCIPPWTETELRHKVADAAKSQHGTDGYMLTTPHPNGNGHHHASSQQETTSVQLSKVSKRKVEWLWPNWLPLGKMCLLDGDPDLGKSTLLLDLAARITTNGVMPNDTEGMTGGVLILSAEDGVEDTILPRLEAAHADLDRISSITEIGGHPPVIPEHLPQIEAAIKRADARLIIIDPMMAFLDVETRSDQQVRRALHPLKKLAERQKCTVVYLRHLNKSAGTRAMYRGGGSIAFIASARSAMLAAADPDNPRLRILAHTKHNLSDEQQSLQYSLQWHEPSQACQVIWHGYSTHKADDLLMPAEETGEKTAKEEAISLLTALLATGPKGAAECYSRGKELKLSESTMRKAKLHLRIETHQEVDEHGQFLRAIWTMPTNTQNTGTPVPTASP